MLSRDIEEPEIDLKALDAASRSLTNNAFLLIGVIGVWFIWRDMLPALRILDDITLWSYTKPGVEGVIPITLLSLGLAILILAVMIVATRQLPAFLEIALLQRLKISQGSRYTVVTLTRYTVVAVGVAWIFSTLGGSWSEIQWIFAALGVGIGFGLQEIVANFISGLIILFERPIRVGDVVTVGNTDGIVTRIQIRATTIRNWDQQELLVPNKNFITQEVTNWSLSDQTTRILINVGIAYGSNVDRAMLILEEAAAEHARVMEDPAPVRGVRGIRRQCPVAVPALLHRRYRFPPAHHHRAQSGDLPQHEQCGYRDRVSAAGCPSGHPAAAGYPHSERRVQVASSASRVRP